MDVLSYTAIQDAGKAIHPSYVEGQMQGGAVQGLGWALNEEYVFDDNGVLENPGFLDYRIPVASDMPMIDTQIVELLIVRDGVVLVQDQRARRARRFFFLARRAGPRCRSALRRANTA